MTNGLQTVDAVDARAPASTACQPPPVGGLTVDGPVDSERLFGGAAGGSMPASSSNPDNLAPARAASVPTQQGPRAAMASAIAELAVIDRELETLEARKAKARAAVSQALSAWNEKTFSCPHGSATLADGAQRVKVEDEALVPAAFLKSAVDTAKAGKALKAGKAVPGLRLETGEPSLRVTFPKAEAAA